MFGLLESGDRGRADPLRAGSVVLEGYESVIPLRNMLWSPL